MGKSKKTMEPSRGEAAKKTKDVNSAKNVGEKEAGSKKDKGVLKEEMKRIFYKALEEELGKGSQAEVSLDRVS
jgi:hypothetical protein